MRIRLIEQRNNLFREHKAVSYTRRSPQPRRIKATALDDSGSDSYSGSDSGNDSDSRCYEQSKPFDFSKPLLTWLFNFNLSYH